MKKREKVRFGGADPIAGIIYANVIGFTLMYTVCRQELLICSVIMCIATSAVYMLLFSLHKKPIGSAIMTGILTTACFGVILILSLMFLDFTKAATVMGEVGEDSYIFFLFTASARFTVAHAAMTIALFSVVIGFICCYFSVTMPRIGFLLLPALIPLILSTRTSQGLPLWLAAILIAAYILAACCTARPYPNNSEIFTDRTASIQRAAAAACIAVMAAFTASVVPKNEETVFEDVLDAMSLDSPGFFSGGGTLGNFTTHSSVNNGNNDPSDTVLFTVNTDTPAFIDRWAFDRCNDSDGWVYIPDYDMGYSNWQSHQRAHRQSELFNALISAAKDGKLEQYANILVTLPETQTVTGDMFIRAADTASTYVIPHPVSTYDVSIDNYDADIYRTARGEMFTVYEIRSGRYLLKYNAEAPCPEYSYAMLLIDFEQLVEAAEAEDIITPTTAYAFLDEYRAALDYRNTTAAYPMDERIYELGQSITADCKSEYEKALAIERWFGAQKFVYDMKFVPESADPAYFLFESKRGICSDFATSLTLLARAAGLSARYVEGFTLSPDAQDEFGTYHVTEANAHAYTQIYITGCGWVNFDATRHVISVQENTFSGQVMTVIFVATGLIAALILVIILFRRPLSQLMLTVTYPIRSNRSRVKGVYLRARSIACEISGQDEHCTTTGETRRTLTNALSMPEEADMICRAADELLYSPDGKVTADTKELYCCLKRIYRRKRGLK